MKRWGWPLLSRALGLLLLAAAGAKVFGLRVEPMAGNSFFSSSELQIGVIFEIFLGLWLLTGVFPMGSWGLSLLTFASFAGISFYLGWVGESSCKCFGRLRVNPWVSFLIDLFALGSLAFFRPPFQPFWQNPRSFLSQKVLPAGIGLGGGAAVLAALFLGVHFRFGSMDAALAHFRGQKISVNPAIFDLGQAALGTAQKETLNIYNWTDHSIKVIGGTSDCSCMVTEDLPLEIPPGEGRPLTVRINRTGGPGIFNRRAILLTDEPNSSKVVFRLTGRNLKPKEKTDQ